MKRVGVGYQRLENNFFDIMKRRGLDAAEAFFVIYFRGKALRYGTPFKLSNKKIQEETGLSEYTIRLYRIKLQIKGIFKFDVGSGHQWTEYTIIDNSLLISRGKVNSTPGVKSTQPLGCSQLNPYKKNNEKKNEKNVLNFSPQKRVSKQHEFTPPRAEVAALLKRISSG